TGKIESLDLGVGKGQNLAVHHLTRLGLLTASFFFFFLSLSDLDQRMTRWAAKLQVPGKESWAHRSVTGGSEIAGINK
ncbi:hypothetical protein OFC47_27500, partial [Escherichia coli]|nr:hypothetical protein [Escherichia coli]